MTHHMCALGELPYSAVQKIHKKLLKFKKKKIKDIFKKKWKKGEQKNMNKKK